MPVSRFGVSLEEDLLKALDDFVIENSYPNRSQAIRALVEKYIVEKKWQCNNVVAGAIVMVYDHHKGDVTTKSNDIQHEFFDVILSGQHFHLSHNTCLEIIAVKGISNRLTELSDKILAIKGVIHGKLIMSKAE
jgi:CopG family transcriptional regulator, nickel-responsive regulator